MKNTVLVIVALAGVVLAGCPDGNDVKMPQKLTVGYLSSFMVDIGDATALGISKQAASIGRNARAGSVKEKNYLVKTTVDYSAGNVEWDENGLTNVTFKKRTTETVTIPIYDNDGNIIGEEPVEDGQTVTQDEIPAQVNRLYVYNNYTFIQFVPETDSIPGVRPDNLSEKDEYGYYYYDTGSYYNDDYHQSFIIENSTGNIYSLDNAVYISQIRGGLLYLHGRSGVWDCRVNDRDELEIFTIFANDAIEFYPERSFKDKYGNNYICNNTLEETMPETNTRFYRRDIYGRYKYYRTLNTNEVIVIDGAQYDGGQLYAVTSIYKIGKNLTQQPITDEDYFELNGLVDLEYVNDLHLYDSDTGDDLVFEGFIYKSYTFTHIKNKELFFYGETMYILDTDTAAVKKRVVLSGLLSTRLISLNTFLIADEVNNNLYYYTVDFEALPAGYHYFSISPSSTDQYDHQYGDGLKLLFENYTSCNAATQGWGNLLMITITKATPTSFDEYKVIPQSVNGKRIPAVVKTSEYVAVPQPPIILKPINR